MTYNMTRNNSLCEASALDPIRGLVNAEVLKEVLLERQKEEVHKTIRRQSIDVVFAIKDMKLKCTEDGTLRAKAKLRLSEEIHPKVEKILIQKGYSLHLESSDLSSYVYTISA